MQEGIEELNAYGKACAGCPRRAERWVVEKKGVSFSTDATKKASGDATDGWMDERSLNGEYASGLWEQAKMG